MLFIQIPIVRNERQCLSVMINIILTYPQDVVVQLFSRSLISLLVPKAQFELTNVKAA